MKKGKIDRSIRIVIVDNHSIYRTGLAFILEGVKNLKVEGLTDSGFGALTMAKEMKPDIVFVDTLLQDFRCVELTKYIKANFPNTKVIGLSYAGEVEGFTSMVQAGADGFLLKKIRSNELEEAISKVLSGEKYYSKEFIINPFITAKKQNLKYTLFKRK